MDFDDIFSSNNSQYQQNQGCDNPFNDFLSLQSPISMPSVEPSNLDMSSSYIGTTTHLTNSNFNQKSFEPSSYASKNRTSEFSNPNYDFSYNFMTSPAFLPTEKSNNTRNELLRNQVPTPQIAIGTTQPSQISENS